MKIDEEMGYIVDTVEDRIQNGVLTAIDSIISPKIELAISSINASSGRDVTIVMASSDCEENIGITASFENVSEKNKIMHVLNTNNETQSKILDEVSELSVPGTHFDRQLRTHYTYVILFVLYKFLSLPLKLPATYV